MGITFSEELRKQAQNGESMVIFGVKVTSKDGQKALLGSKDVTIEETMLPHNAAAALKAVRDIWDKDQAERAKIAADRAAAPQPPKAQAEVKK